MLRTAMFIALTLPWLAVSAAAAPPSVLRFTLRGERIEGLPVFWGQQQAIVLGRDGRLWDFDPAEGADFGRLLTTFRSYSQAEMRGTLMRQFGRRMAVTGTGHYLVVHPPGQTDRWPARFEQLYRSFVHYFTARGMRPATPQFPLVAVVFESQNEFARYAASQGTAVGPGVLGYYSQASNRILLYDVAGPGGDDRLWSVNADTIIHEATHQVAFNTGIHDRLAPPPLWVAEGLATMFEARGVWNSQQYGQRDDRINQGRLEYYRRISTAAPDATWLEPLLRSDRPFRADPGAAYARAWALSFYLMETQPGRFWQYLQKTASRADFAPYPTSQRLADFTRVFGANLPLLEAHVRRFFDEL